MVQCFRVRFSSLCLFIRRMSKSKGKNEVAGPAPLLGRVGTSLKVGIVGLPNVGKSTFFNVITKSSAPAENFPFCTINPNESRVAVPDARFDHLVEYFKPASRVPPFLHVVDIAGLVRGAHEGQGLGNSFLSHISACDAIFHCLRAFDDEEVTHVDGEVNPVRDLETIHDELRLKDEQYCTNRLSQLEKLVARGNDKSAKPEFDLITKVLMHLQGKTDIRFGQWSNVEIELLNKHLFLTAKPVIYLINLSERDFIRKKNKWLKDIKAWVDAKDPNATMIPFSGAFEQTLVDFQDDVQADSYCASKGAQSSLAKIIVNGYKALSLQYFFTCGEDEVRGWTIQRGTKAPQAAGKIHTDFEKGFIMAEVMKYDDFKELGSESAVKAGGKHRQQGRNYIVDDGDIILFKFNAGAGLTAGKKK